MKVKIFPTSSNLYQDQAQVLYDYYRQAAERIVVEEEAIEAKQKEQEARKAEIETKLAGVWVWLFCFIIPYFIKKKALEKELAVVEAELSSLAAAHKAIYRDYKVSKLGVAFVPVAEQVLYGNQSFVVDYTGQHEIQELSIQIPRQNALLAQTISQIQALSVEAPLVEGYEDTESIDTDQYSTSIQELPQNDYLGTLERSLRTITYCLGDLETRSVNLPLVPKGDDYIKFLQEYGATTLEEGAKVLPIYAIENYQEGIQRFEELNKLRESVSSQTEEFSSVLKQMMTTMAHTVQTVSALKVASTEKLVNSSNKTLYQILKAPYNHYSSRLEYDEIERIRLEQFDYSQDLQGYQPFNLRPSSRMSYNPMTSMWVAEDGSQDALPFGMHQLYEEIVAPVVQNLMEETRIERLKIYNQIKDQKVSYLNKWHQDTEAFYMANRQEAGDLKTEMQKTLGEYVEACNNLAALKKTEASMSGDNFDEEATGEAMQNDVENTAAESVVAFEQQAQEFIRLQDEFEAFMERLTEDINLKAERFGHIEYYDAKLRDGYANSVATATAGIAQLEERRRHLALTNPYLAREASLLPEPQVESLTGEHLTINLEAQVHHALGKLQEEEQNTQRSNA